MPDALVLTRAVHLAASVLMAGTLIFDTVIAASLAGASPRRQTGRLLWSSAAIVLLSGALWAVLVAAAIDGRSPGEAVATGTLTTLLGQTRFGRIWLIRGALVITAALTAASGRLRTACALAIAGLAAISWTGHAGAQSGLTGYVLLSADVIHLTAAGAWLGGLPALAVTLSSDRIDASARMRAARRFSALGLCAVAALAVSGTIDACILVGSPAGLVESRYGQILSAKALMFACMLGCAATSRLYWSRRLPSSQALSAIAKLASIEIALGICVMVAVGALGTVAPPFHIHVQTNDSSPGAFVHIHDVDTMADVRALPGTAGSNDISVRLLADDFTPLAAARSVTIRLTDKSGHNSNYAAKSTPDEVWHARGVRFGTPGVWTVTIIVHTADGRTLSLDGPLVIETKLPAQGG